MPLPNVNVAVAWDIRRPHGSAGDPPSHLRVATYCETWRYVDAAALDTPVELSAGGAPGARFA